MRVRIRRVFGRHAVGVFRREEAPLRVGHLAHHVLERVFRHLGKEPIGGQLIRLEARQRDLRLVVQHLLEMRHPPVGVDRIAVKTAADVVAHAAERHRLQRLRHHEGRRVVARARGLAQEKQQLARTRKLRRAAKPAARLVERLRELRDTFLQRIGVGHVSARRHRSQPSDLLGEIFSRQLHFGALLLPHADDLAKDLRKSRPAPPRVGREIRAAVKRLEIGRQPHAHRPAARPGRRLHERHVDAIDVGPLFAIHLDRDEIAIQDVGNRLAFERLVRHHVAPVARRVADRQKDRAVELARFVERLLPPGVPVDRILGVLQEIRAALGSQTIRHSVGLQLARMSRRILL